MKPYQARMPLFALLCLLSLRLDAATGCAPDGVWLQVLGSGGPELADRRASSGYLVWVDGKARLLVDAGTGVALHFGQSGARFADLDAIAFSHFHVDHGADLPAFIKSGFFSGRDRDLPLYGPVGNGFMPATTEFVQSLFGDKQGAFRYLASYLDGGDEYRIQPHDIDIDPHRKRHDFRPYGLSISAIPVHHGPVPALAWRVEVSGKSMTFSGDMNGDWHGLELLAAGTDLLVAHNAVPENATGVARFLHMPPSVIGRIAATAGAGRLVLSHRMTRTLGRERETLAEIRKTYPGKVDFADDMDCFRP